MFGLVYNTVNSGVYGLAGMTIGYFDMFLLYIVAIIVSVIVALALKLPLLPGKPHRYSFDVSAIYPTPIISIGVLSVFLVLNYTFAYNGFLLAVIIGVLSGVFVKYLFYHVFPSPDMGDVNE